jgi:hypothetical protein
MEITSYVLCQVRIEGLDAFFCNGLKVTDDTESTAEYQGGSRDLFGITFKKRKIKFEILEPKDHAQLNQLRDMCVEEGKTFTIIAFGQNAKGNWEAMERLEGCTISGRERTIGNFEAPKLSVKGVAAKCTPVKASYT